MNLPLRGAAIAVALALSGQSGPAAAAPSDSTFHAINAARTEYQAARKAIEGEDWDTALAALRRAESLDPGNAEVQNQIGFTLRQQGEFDLAVKHYFRALELDPFHRGAHEYLGRAWLHLGQPDKARELLGRLKDLCPPKCPERDLLQQAITEWDPWQRPMRVGRYY